MDGFVLVTGATGKQGGATARALHAAGTPVHALVRDPDADRARTLAELGITVVRGDLDDPASVVAAARGARGVFSIQMPDLEDLMGDRELRHATAIAGAVRENGVAQVVHTSVSGAGTHGEPGAVDEQAWGEYLPHYWRNKLGAERILTGAGARYTTVLRPGGFLENLLPPSPYFAGDTPGPLQTAADLDIALPWIAVADIGAAAAAAFADPERFGGVTLELAGERLTFRELAATLARAWDVPIEPVAAPETTGFAAVLTRSQEFTTAFPAPADPRDARAAGIDVTGVAEWAAAQTVLRPSAR
ncbi:NmrA family NAD(P)-binding protein [Pseudonocardia sp. HH130630-07]|uniref:NmrA family NAD(P)-binding protein n=1 Tax=Pseudonocardia sp. HH130630-07 TaxID=1690815 RepID=UPI000814E566|nr:NmrA family NAD(P)-binding protein [Pseudonocardia sp. HH130630-07]ANY05601.1 hypothetical protein AFB00_03950 [Pseudonocardia sp. HH130630-07]